MFILCKKRYRYMAFWSSCWKLWCQALIFLLPGNMASLEFGLDTHQKNQHRTIRWAILNIMHVTKNTTLIHVDTSSPHILGHASQSENNHHYFTKEPLLSLIIHIIHCYSVFGQDPKYNGLYYTLSLNREVFTIAPLYLLVSMI